MTPKLLLGAVLALAGACVGAVLWAAVTGATHWQIGYMAVGVALLSAYAMRLVTGAGGRVEAVTAAVIALLGCLLGNVLASVVMIAQHEHAPILEILTIVAKKPSLAIGLLQDGFNVMDLLFYGIALYTAYRTLIQPSTPRVAAPPPAAAPPTSP